MLAQEVRCGRQIRAAHRLFPCQAFQDGTRPCRVHLQICAPPTLLNFCCNILISPRLDTFLTFTRTTAIMIIFKVCRKTQQRRS